MALATAVRKPRPMVVVMEILEMEEPDLEPRERGAEPGNKVQAQVAVAMRQQLLEQVPGQPQDQAQEPEGDLEMAPVPGLGQEEVKDSKVVEHRGMDSQEGKLEGRQME